MRRPRGRLFNRAAATRAIALIALVAALVAVTVYVAASHAPSATTRMSSLTRPRS